MSVQTKYFRSIDIPKDGNCLFRSIVIFLNEHLIRCRRSRQGLPSNKNYADYENNCSAFLRKSIVRMIRARKQRYSSPGFFDPERYNSIDERIDKMSKEGEFGGKLEMDIISKMYKLNINVFIPFNGDYSCIYKSNSDNSAINLQSVVDDQESIYNDSDCENDFEYSEGRYCFLLLDNNRYTILEPNYLQIKDDLKQDEVSESSDTVEENIKIHIADRQHLINYNSSSEISENSILGSSLGTNSLNFEDDGFEKIGSLEDMRSKCNSPSEDKFTDKLNEYLLSKKNALLVHSENSSKLLELKDHYKGLAFNNVIDIINSIEEWN